MQNKNSTSGTNLVKDLEATVQKLKAIHQQQKETMQKLAQQKEGFHQNDKEKTIQ